MKKLFVMLVAGCLAAATSYSQVIIPDDRDDRRVRKEKRVRDNGDLPPGHAKKVYGDRSAKAYAPGQRKRTQVTTRRRSVVIGDDAVVQQDRDRRIYRSDVSDRNMKHNHKNKHRGNGRRG